MALFKDKKEGGEKQSTLDEVMAAYERLSDEDKGKFHESLKDRVDQSVGETNKLEGNENKESTDERVDQAIGEKLADDRREEEKEDAKDEESDEKEKTVWDAIRAEMDGIKERLAKLEEGELKEKQAPKEVEDDKQAMLNKLMSRYSTGD